MDVDEGVCRTAGPGPPSGSSGRSWRAPAGAPPPEASYTRPCCGSRFPTGTGFGAASAA